MRPSSRRSFCEWKGEARYWILDIAGQTFLEVGWSYADPTPAFAYCAVTLPFTPVHSIDAPSMASRSDRSLAVFTAAGLHPTSPGRSRAYRAALARDSGGACLEAPENVGRAGDDNLCEAFCLIGINAGRESGTPVQAPRSGGMLSTKTMFNWADPGEEQGRALLSAYIADQGFPCVGAKAALAKGTLDILGGWEMGSAWDDLRIHERLRCFAAQYRAEPSLFRSFAVVFSGPDDLSEEAFERAMWQRIQSLSDKDVWLGQEWDRRVSPDPSNPHFSLSFGGEAFFVVGLHPRASRPARRFSRPTMIFNLHDQFETLREQGKYETMREKIMVRDEVLAGSRNPMLSRHGEISEARQYSGRAVESGWQCPFRYSGE